MQRYLIAIIGLFISASTIWAGWKQFANKDDSFEAQNSTMRQACKEVLTIEDFTQVCPSSARGPRLRLMVYPLSFGELYKCSISVTADSRFTFHMVIDVFKNANLAGSRMWYRVYDGVAADSRRLLAEEYGNLLGLNEPSALDRKYGNYNLLLWRDNVYAEIMPTAGKVCSGEELYTLGRLIYARLPDFSTQSL